MKVSVLREAGYEEALLGLSLSYGKPVEEMPQVAEKLYSKDDSEGKFLRQICVWLDVTAPWRWWKQMAEYRIGMEWNIESQSSSTMHTIMNRPLTQGDFECEIPEDCLRLLNALIGMGDFEGVTCYLPGGFLYRRVLMTNYQTLRRIFQQRHLHKLREWIIFIQKIEDQVKRPEWLREVKVNDVE